ncbi:MAG: hypothetical protein ACM3VS_16640 [Candidatus Dadabacteria bacterium]
MNKLLLYFTVIAILSCYIKVSYAQEDTMKSLPAVVIHSRSNVEKAVTSAFDKRFRDAMDAQWYKMNKNYLVTFIATDMKNSALFKQNGRLIYHVSYGTEQHLPVSVKKQVQDSYRDYNVTRAVNVKMNDRDVWMVNLEGTKRYLIVAVEDGELIEMETVKKAS